MQRRGRADRHSGAFATLVMAIVLALATPAAAVIIASGNGTGNTTAPADDPGFANVGRRGGESVVYLGNRWILTARHVGIATVRLDEVPYAVVPDSAVAIGNADLRVFKLIGDPGLPPVEIAASPPPVGADLVMAGRGRDRGAAGSWLCQGRKDGFLWDTTATIRWGTNVVSTAPYDRTLNAWTTRTISTTFTQSGGTPHEAQAANGDSGGAVFHKSAGQWELAGLVYAITQPGCTPPESAVYGDETHFADLSFYRDAILAEIGAPGCSDGLDDDGDGLVDHPADPGCDGPDDNEEWSASLGCDDGLDNDGDGSIDHAGGPFGEAPDPECQGDPLGFERPRCGLGAELALALLGLVALPRKRRR